MLYYEIASVNSALAGGRNPIFINVYSFRILQIRLLPGLPPFHHARMHQFGFLLLQPIRHQSFPWTGTQSWSEGFRPTRHVPPAAVSAPQQEFASHVLAYVTTPPLFS